jgi:hypothetical protein
MELLSDSFHRPIVALRPVCYSDIPIIELVLEVFASIEFLSSFYFPLSDRKTAFGLAFK